MELQPPVADILLLFLLFCNTPFCRFLVSKLFDVTESSQLADMYEHKPIRIPYGKGIVGYVAESGETVNIPDAYQVREREREGV